jgi:2-dehydropantoate 2-reductase
MAPGHFVRDRLHRLVGPARAVFGSIGMISYVAPLAGSADRRETSTPAGLAYLLSPTRLSSASEARALDAVTTLRLGGCPCDLVSDATGDVTISSASLMPNVAALEIAGWSFRSFRAPEISELAARATRESIAIAARVAGRSEPAYAGLVSAFVLSAVARVVPYVMPLDIETFLRVHFVKVGEQTRLLLATSVADGARLGLPSDALSELLAKLDEGRSSG